MGNNDYEKGSDNFRKQASTIIPYYDYYVEVVEIYYTCRSPGIQGKFENVISSYLLYPKINNA